MGSPESESGHKGNETQHSVILTRHFYIGAYEVTQEQWQAIMGSNPSYSKGDQLPVEMVSWNDCQEFCKRATKKDLDAKRIPEGWKYRLPTEAEQEYACRAGTTTPFHYGETLDSTQANIDGEKTLPVGSFKPNAWGLYDMHGNVYEWCQDYWSGYPTDEATDPVPTTPHPRRVYRGGAWKFNAATARSAKRSQRDPAKAFDFMGLRLVLTNNQ